MRERNERRSVPFFTKFILFILAALAFGFNLFLLLVVTGVFVFTDDYIIKLIYIGIYALSFVFVLFVIRRPINTNYKVTWAVFLLAFPIPFSLLYLFQSLYRVASKRKRLKIQNRVSVSQFVDEKDKLWNVDSLAANMVSVVQKSTYAPVYTNVKFTFFDNVKDKFEDLLVEANKAEHYIFIEYFTISDGKLWSKLYPVLKSRGEAGVEIKILFDDIGSKLGMRQRLLKSLDKIPNLKINTYERVGETSSFLLNYRDHRKIFIIDGRVAYCGGDNLADEYIHEKNRFGYWRDNCGKYEGNIVNTFVQMFREMWYISGNEYISDDIYIPSYENKGEGFYMAFSDGPLYKGNPTYDLFTIMIATATKSIHISTPYFIIDDALLNMLCLKAKAGVDVRLLMPGIPDKKAPYYMGRGLYKPLILAGGKIYEFVPGFNHAKNLVVDGKYAYVGTTNFDYRSLFLHYECGALIMYDKEINKIEEDYLDALDYSERITMDKYKKTPKYQRLWAFIISIFNPMF